MSSWASGVSASRGVHSAGAVAATDAAAATESAHRLGGASTISGGHDAPGATARAHGLTHTTATGVGAPDAGSGGSSVSTMVL